jgi:hypothetical protein
MGQIFSLNTSKDLDENIPKEYRFIYNKLKKKYKTKFTEKEVKKTNFIITLLYLNKYNYY